ncbi:hypothetical protein QJS10_CPA07g00940 [Acorus calamus]|uniref:Uncharacterized protein n=1 Tax=Acorus calamus TaxID=4465 RepID=A0AAV9EIH2_ACOCL|nr:hypothetical protein QJS10_CPA07g00940 [Acorus calamus]
MALIITSQPLYSRDHRWGRWGPIPRRGFRKHRKIRGPHNNDGDGQRTLPRRARQ